MKHFFLISGNTCCGSIWFLDRIWSRNILGAVEPNAQTEDTRRESKLWPHSGGHEGWQRMMNSRSWNGVDFNALVGRANQ